MSVADKSSDNELRVRIREILYVITALAVMLGLSSPWLRELKWDAQFRVGLVWMGAFIGFSFVASINILFRYRGQRSGGGILRKICFGNKWTRNWLSFSFVIIGLFGFGSLIYNTPSVSKMEGIPYSLLILMGFSPGVLFGTACVFLRWRPDAIEFREQGMLVGNIYKPWKSVQYYWTGPGEKVLLFKMPWSLKIRYKVSSNDEKLELVELLNRVVLSTDTA